jgi:hypothetical protein
MSMSTTNILATVSRYQTRKPALIPFGRAKGREALRITEVLTHNVDGTRTLSFECKVCERNFGTYAGAQGHLGSHPKDPDRPRKQRAVKSTSPAVRELVGILEENENLNRKIDALKQKLTAERGRRAKAENRLRQIERLFGGRAS